MRNNDLFVLHMPEYKEIILDTLKLINFELHVYNRKQQKYKNNCKQIYGFEKKLIRSSFCRTEET